MSKKEEGQIGDICLKLAQKAINEYVRNRNIFEPDEDELPKELLAPRAVFVSLYKDDELRGCIGTVEPTTECMAYEIVQNAISAAVRDPRFYPVDVEELPDLHYSVYLLNPAELIGSEDQLDPKIYGVIVQTNGKRGLLLPDLEGVDTVEKQIEIAKTKAGITPNESARLFRFTVTKYGEDK